ncbi:hypothetical protein HKBW3S25_00488 [Candidatus Hakubella thermalkaliphila]|uniref:Glycosyltransferase 2-like domain-containing protein n=1 Tax=Candidatus Hakubella thermalkaliphila TaxID=2754717 RepID=A0A6V8NXQ5_9ACTN|nr:hypothetical protein HKBW3S25_00488 [Candidatus Hakubella thermalkaliphila]
MPALVSLVLPFYNEEASVAKVISDVHAALGKAGVSFEIIAVENGSRDATGEILAELEKQYKELRIVHVRVNQGFGYGIMQGLSVCAGDIVGFMPGDGQVDPSVVLEILQRMEDTGAEVGKARRVVHHDGWQRRFISRSYNLLMRFLFGLPTDDTNGHPKLLTRRAYSAMHLRSHDSFLDAEILLKAQRLGVRVCEVNTKFHKRETGRSTVRLTTCVEFLCNLMQARFQREDPWGLNKLSASQGRAGQC